MMFGRVVAAVAVAGTAVIGFGGAAQADTHHHDPQVAWVHHVKVHDDTATLKALYRCWGGDEGTHLWVSLKQGDGLKGSAKALSEQEGTSALATAWYDSHPGTDAGTKGVHCNGSWHVQKFTVNREKGDLEDGRAFLQFCLFDSTADPQGMDLSHGFGYLYKWVHVDD